VSKVTLFLLCLFVAFMPFEMMAYFDDVFSGAKIFGALVVGAGVLAFLTGQRVRKISPPLVLRVVLVLFSAMSLAWTLDTAETLFTLERFVLLLIFVLFIWEFAVAYQDQVWLLRSFLFGMIVPLIMAYLGFAGSSRFAAEGGERFSGGGQDLNYLAYMYAVSIMIAVYLATNSLPLDRFCRWFYWGMAVLCAIGSLLTGSRGGFICLIAAAVFSMIMSGVSRRRLITSIQILAMLAFVYLLARYLVPTALLDRVTWSQSVLEDPRIGIWTRGLSAFLGSPLIGVGSGAYAVVAAIGDKRSLAHNTFVSVLVELGIVGLGLYLAYAYMLFRTAWRLPRREKWLWIGVLSIWFFNANTAGSQTDKFSWFLQVMVLVQAAAYALHQPAKRVPNLLGRAVPFFRGRIPPRFRRT
jgi:O-antigen ligase